MLAKKDNPHSINGETDRFAYRFVKPCLGIDYHISGGRSDHICAEFALD
jgi:hypothetical protein